MGLPRGPNIISIFMPVARQWKGFQTQPRYCGTCLNKAYMPPEKSFLRRRPFKNIKSGHLVTVAILQQGITSRNRFCIILEQTSAKCLKDQLLKGKGEKCQISQNLNDISRPFNLQVFFFLSYIPGLSHNKLTLTEQVNRQK